MISSGQVSGSALSPPSSYWDMRFRNILCYIRATVHPFPPMCLKRAISALRVTATLLLAVLLLGGAAPAMGRTLLEIRATDGLRACVAGSSRSFYQNNARDFARYLGVPVVVRTLGSWDEQFQNQDGRVDYDGHYVARLLENGECDLFPNDLHLLDWRLSKMALVPYYTVRKMVVAHQRLRETVHSAADLAGLRAAVQKGTAYDSWLLQENASTYRDRPVRIEYHSTRDSVQRVSRGLDDFTLTGSEGAFKWIRSGEFENLDLLFPVDDLVSVGWGIAPSAHDLHEALSRYFEDSMQVGSDLDRAWQRYYGISRVEYKFFEQSLDTRAAELAAVRVWLLPLGTGFAGLLMAMWAWNGRLRREAAAHRSTAAQLEQSRLTLEQESGRRLAVSQIQLALQRTATAQEFAQALLSELARHMPAQQALMCGVAEDRLYPLARYAGPGDDPGAMPHADALLASLLHEAVRLREDRLIENTEGCGLRLSSGLGSGAPASLLIHPVLFQGEPLAVLEFASFQVFQADDLALLHMLMPFVAVSLDRLRGSVPQRDT